MKNMQKGPPSSVLDLHRYDPNQGEDVSYDLWWFHFTYCCACMFIGMQLSNWNQDVDAVVTQDSPATWVKVVFAWMTSLLYLWSLVAPIVLKHRDFS